MEYKTLSKIYYSDKTVEKNEYKKIYEDRVNGESCVRYDFEIKGFPAFLVYSKEMVLLISNIYRLDREIRDKASETNSYALEYFTIRCLIDEIRLTNQIEGVASTKQEISGIVERIDKKRKNEEDRLEGLVRKYLLLKDDELELDNPKDFRNIYDALVSKEIHKENPKNDLDGEIFRKDKVSVIKNNQVIHTGLTPESEIIEYIEKLIKVAKDEKTEPLIRIAIVHYLMGYIHPFYDGNGRVSRFLSSKLITKELIDLLGYWLSYAISENGAKYYKSFAITNEAKNRGDLTPFVISFLELIVSAEEEVLLELTKLKEKEKSYVEAIKNIENIGNEIKDLLNILLIISLYGQKGLTNEEIGHQMSCSYSTVRNRVKEAPNGAIIISKENKKNLYEFNLDYFPELNSY